MTAVRVREHGGPDVLRCEDTPVIEHPEPGEVVVELKQIGVNFIDVYQRRGFYRMTLPFTPGNEGAGTVVAAAPDVRDFAPGDRVAFAMVSGAYAERARVPASSLVRLPSDVDTRTAAAIMLQGLTAQYLTRTVFPLAMGDTMAINAAAGGLGLLMVQIGRHLGARVIALTSTAEKAQVAKAAGASDVVLSSRPDFDAAIRDLTSGRGVDVFYDSVGKDTFSRSVACLRPRGSFVLVGQASGAVPPIDVPLLAARSLFFTRPGLKDYIATVEELHARASELFQWLRAGAFRPRIDSTFALAQAADAHRRLESRQSVGKILLSPCG